TMDRPEHTRLRKVVTRYFTSEAASRQREFAEEFTVRALDRMIARGGGAFATELAMPLPVAVIANILGVPQADLPSFRRWSDGIVEGFNTQSDWGNIGGLPRVIRSIVQLHRYVERQLE